MNFLSGFDIFAEFDWSNINWDNLVAAPATTASTAPAETETKTEDTWPRYDINKGMMVNKDGTAYVAPKAAPVPSAAPAEPEDVGLTLGARKPKAPVEQIPIAPPELAPSREAPRIENKISQEPPPPPLPPSTVQEDTGGWPRYDINKGIMVNKDGTAYVAPKGAVTPTGGETKPEDTGLVFGAGAGAKPKTPAELAGLQFGVGGPGVITGTGTTAVSPDQAAKNAGLVPGAGGPDVITGTGGTGTSGTGTSGTGTGGTGKNDIPSTPIQYFTAPDGKIFTDLNAYNDYIDKLNAAKTEKENAPTPVEITTNIGVMKALLTSMGFNSAIIDSSTDFLMSLLKDGLDYDNAVSVFLNSKDYTTKDGKTRRSPFYEEYGYLNEGLTRAKSPAEIYNAVEGYKEIVGKYQLNQKFITKDYLKKYVQNNVTVAQLDERANTARLKAVNADPAYLESLRQLGYISSSVDLTDFFMDPTVGQETMEQKRATAAFATEAIRRAQQGIQFSGDRFSKAAAGLLNLGLSEAQIGVRAAEGFENIAEQLSTTQKLASIYQKLPATEMQNIQQELEAEQFAGTASQRRKMLAALETSAFQGSSGVGSVSLRRGPVYGQI